MITDAKKLHQLGVKTSILLWIGMGALVAYLAWKKNTTKNDD